MGPSDTVHSAGPPEGPATYEQVDPATPPAGHAAPGTNQCGRCRQFFAIDVAAPPAPKFWTCPPCHRRLFGTD